MIPEPTAALARLAGQPRVLVATDFDGTISPFVVDPLAARAAPGALEALRALAGMPATTVALVSGRDLDTLAHLTGIPVEWEPGQPVLIASHGAQSSEPRLASAVGPHEASRREEVRAALARVAGRHPGARLEIKAAAVALHTRGMPEQAARAALTEARTLGSDLGEVRVVLGSSVVELALSHADKGSALTRLSALAEATAVAYFGDDRTDEDAFVALAAAGLDAVGVKVGPGESAAGYRLVGPPEVAAALMELARLRRDATAS